jgi:hypothetical protein
MVLKPRMGLAELGTIPSTTIDSTTMMVSSLAVSTPELTQNMIKSKLQGDQEPLMTH